jgi:hypothetical protein
LNEGAKALLALPQLILCPLALGDIAHQAQIAASALLELVQANLHRERGGVLAPVAGLESDGFPGDAALLQALDGRIVETDVEIAFMFADQFFPAVAQTMAGLAVDVENGPIIVKQKEGVGRAIHEDAEAPLARAQLFLRLPQLRDVLQDAKLAQRPPRFVPRHVALAADYPLGAVGADHPVFHVVAWPAGQQGSRSRLGCSRSVLGVNQLQPAFMPLRQLDRLHPEDPAHLVRKSYLSGAEVTFPPAKMRDPLRLQQPGFTFAQHFLRALAFRDVARQR